MTYCANCGSALAEGARFCSNCGTPAESAGAPRQTEPESAQQPSGEPHAHEPHEGATGHGPDVAGEQSATPGATATAGAGAGPFSGIPIADYVRDGLAALSLVISLFMVWRPDSGSTTIAATRIDVILITLLSILSLTIPYLWRAGVFGARWNYAKTQDLRLAANAPYVILVLVYLILDGVAVRGIGPALAFGLGGALLAAQPRRSELADGDVARDRRWSAIVLGVAGLVVAITLVQILESVVRGLLSGAPLGYSLGLLISSIILVVANAGLVVFVAVLVSRGSEAARLVAVGLGVAGAALILLGLFPSVWLVSGGFSVGATSFLIAFWLPLGAAAAAPSTGRLTAHGADTWRRTVSGVIDLSWATSALIALLSIVALFTILLPDRFYGSTNIVPWIIAVIFGLLGIAGGFIARATLRRDTRQAFLVAGGYAALLFVLGIVLVVVWSIMSLGFVSPLTLFLAFALPFGLLAALWLPAESRAHYAALPTLAASGGFSFAGAPAPQPSAPMNPPVDAYGQAQTTAYDTSAAGWPAPYSPQPYPTQPGPQEAIALQQAAETPAGAQAWAPPATPEAAEPSEVAGDEPQAFDETVVQAAPQRAAGGHVAAQHAASERAAGSASERSDAVDPESSGAVSAPAEERPGVDSGAGQPADRGTVDASALGSEATRAETAPSGVVAEAGDPSTPATRLHQIAAEHPEARAAVASNPSTYPALLEWLGQLGDPEIDAALAQRR